MDVISNRGNQRYYQPATVNTSRGEIQRTDIGNGNVRLSGTGVGQMAIGSPGIAGGASTIIYNRNGQTQRLDNANGRFLELQVNGSRGDSIVRTDNNTVTITDNGRQNIILHNDPF